MSQRLTLATSTGLPFLVLAFHVATGFVAFIAGYVAIATRKGGRWHRRSGLAFTYAMTAMGIAAVSVGLTEGKEDFTGGAMAAYLVLTGFTAIRPPARGARHLHVGLMVLAFSLAAAGYAHGFTALGRPRHQIDGVPAGMIFFMTTIILLAALGDARQLRSGAVAGARRLARHLWRMCFGLFIASGSFLLGQMKFVPQPIRVVPVLLVVAVSPLAVLLYWMWRVRLRQNLRGLMTTGPITAGGSAGYLRPRGSSSPSDRYAGGT